jgi:hypothetical protein
MTRITYMNTVICDGCGVEITWAPVVVHQRTFCCRDCAEGRPCECDYLPDEMEDSRTQSAPVTEY